MKKIMVFMGLILLANFADEAAAASCGTNTNQLNGVAVFNALNGKFVCATRGTDKWRECHGTLSAPSFNTCVASGSLWDLKLGTDPVDPAKNVGSWSRTGNIVTYNYGTGGSYSYELYHDAASSTYDFCGTSPAGNNVVNATIQNGTSPCP